ncbi:formin-like protein 9 [Sorghum bicolor]|uniref:formin-like protein 9 n=1 Tax=Sorghum bicolor TaxID=4558 RepID=UPI000B4266C4|nr:formin-like protein 9 [Sorghum bicolor]|eukprot:XP_021321365.1 formin-like protein 9 [Sorghum bicolor]
MGLAVKRVFLLTASLVLLLLSFELLLQNEVLLRRVSHGCNEVSAVAVTRDAGSGFLSRFRMLAVSLDHHHRSPPRHPHRSHQKSSAAPAPAPAIQVHEALPTPTPTLAAPAPAPLPHESHTRMPLRNHSRIAPARSVARKLGGGGGHARLPTPTIVGLAVAGACLLVLGVAVAAAASLRRSRKLQKKPFKLFSHGSRAHRSTCATIKVSSHPSADLLYPGSAVQCQEDYAIIKESSESKSLSVLLTPSISSAELIISDYAVKTSTSLQSDEADSFRSLPCSHSSGGSITELPLPNCDKSIADPSPSSRHRDDSPSSSSYQSLSPDCRSPFCPKTPPFTASDQAHVQKTFCHLPENPAEEKTEVINHQKTAKATNNSGSMGHPEAPKVEQVNAKLSYKLAKMGYHFQG